ncbi:MAG: hypothetical protein V2A72_06295 [Candidatus Omnitrophota bacterium]
MSTKDKKATLAERLTAFTAKTKGMPFTRRAGCLLSIICIGLRWRLVNLAYRIIPLYKLQKLMGVVALGIKTIIKKSGNLYHRPFYTAANFFKILIIAIWWRIRNAIIKFSYRLKSSMLTLCKRFMLKPLYRFASHNFFMLMYPVNSLLAVALRNKKYKDSVLHISYMVHIPYYTTRILRRHGIKADYLAVGGKSPWWDKYDYNFYPVGPWQEFLFFWKVVARYEVIHSHFGIILSQTGWELPFLKLMGRKIVLHYRGCEARDPEKNKKLHPDVNICQHCDYEGWVCRKGKKRIQRIKKYVDISLVTTPDMKEFIPDAIHFPFFTPCIDYEKFRNRKAAFKAGEKVKIVHVTNHPGIEGTSMIRKAIDNLRDKGHDIDFVFLKGVTPEQALAEYRDADFSVGKLKMGYYANAQIESMFLDVPSITYARPEFMTQELRDSGFIFTSLKDLEKTLEFYITNPDEYEKKKLKARQSILKLHDNDKLSKQLLDIYGMKVAVTQNETNNIKRPFRVLHIGNIANNAYYNAKFLRREGVEADVLCYDNYWVMSSPEWEEADFEGTINDQQHPDWWRLNLRGYERPRWFAQGPFDLCVRYLAAKNLNMSKESEGLWLSLENARKIVCKTSYTQLLQKGKAVKKILQVPSVINRIIRILHDKTLIKLSAGLKARHDVYTFNGKPFHEKYLAHCSWLIDKFSKCFPDRPDRLTMDDLLPYEHRVSLLQGLFQHYDIIQGYATDPIFPILNVFHPYVAFEHGTLRDSPEIDWAYKGPFYDSPLSRLTALSYRMADYVFVTNTDCIQSAYRLGIENFELLPHPLDEENFSYQKEARNLINRTRNLDYIFFCPIRHDWQEKGVNRYIKILPRLRELIKGKFRVFFIPWGKEIQKSKHLINELGCNDLVEWVGPFGRVKLAQWLSAADVVLDQLVYPSFSGVTPRALACGAAVIVNYKPGDMDITFPEPPPVLSAQTEDEIIEQLFVALRPGFVSDHREKARFWIEKYHSSKQTLERMLAVYKGILAKKGTHDQYNQKFQEQMVPQQKVGVC